MSSKYESVTQHLLTLGEGRSIRVAIPEGWTQAKWAQGLRGRLNGDKRLMYTKWRVRLKENCLLVTKAGSWILGGGTAVYEKPKPHCSVCGKEGCGRRKRRCKVCADWFHNHKVTNKTCSTKCGHALRVLDAEARKPLPEEMPLCACGCGVRTKTLYGMTKTLKSGEIVKAGEPVRFLKGHRLAKMGRCLSCGRDFKLKKRKFCCSRACANAIGYGYRSIGKKPWEKRPKQWHRLRCVICRRFVWRKNASPAKVCYSLSCRQKATARRNGWSKVPHDKKLLAPLVAQGLLCADIGRLFGAASGESARVAIVAVGLVPNLETKEQRLARVTKASRARWGSHAA